MNESNQFPLQPAPPISATLTAQKVDAKPRSGAGPVLLHYWRMVIRWKWVILGILVMAAIAGVVATLAATPQYSASTRIEISRDQKKITNVEGVEPQSGGRDIEFYQTQYALLKARSLAERVARTLRLGTDAEFLAARGGKAPASGKGPITAEERAKRDKVAANMLLAGITINPVRGSSLVDIQYTSASPTVSARIANAWAKEFIASTLERRFASTADARAFLANRLNELRAKLETSERALTDYAVSRGIVRLSTRENAEGRTQVDRTLVGENLQALNEALATATAERIAAEGAMRGSSASNAAALSNQTIAALRQRRAEVAAELAKNLTQFEAGYPTNVALREQVEQLDRSITSEERRVLSGYSTTYKQAMSREQGLQAQVNALRGQLDTEQRDTIQYNILQRDADSNRQLYEGLLQRDKEIGVAGVGANNISIVDAANPPGGPTSPNLMMNVIIALLIGIAVAAGATQVLDHIDEGLRDLGQVGDDLELPLLGSIPFVAQAEASDALHDPKSATSEAFLTARSNLSFTTEHGVPRSFVITSTRPSEGKSSTAFGLATALAKVGKRVLLVDGDMRRPSQHVRTGVANSYGLSNVLAGDDNWAAHIKQTDLGAYLLPSGPLPPSAAELLSTDRLVRVVGTMLESFDYVIIDAPPMLGLADAPLIARAVVGVVYVIESEGPPMRGIRASIERLVAGRAHIFGVVVTKLKRRAGGYGYGYNYEYGYGQDEKGERDGKAA